jgi:glycosyl transferase family 2
MNKTANTLSSLACRLLRLSRGAPVGMSGPLVSVIIPVWNAAAFIGQTVKSVLAQTFRDYELFIVNDGSPDTAELEAALLPYRDSLKYLPERHRGAAAARNAALRVATGTYVAFLDADDLWLPNYLEEQIAFLSARPDVDLVYADAKLTGDSPLAGRTFMETAPSRGPVTLKSLLSLRCHVIASGVVVRRSAVMDVGMFDESISRGHDFDLWVRLARRGARMAYQRRVLLQRHIHDSNLSGDAVSECERALAALRRIDASMTLAADERAALNVSMAWLSARRERELGKRCLRTADFAGAIDAIERAYRAEPSFKLRVISLGLRLAPSWLYRLDRARQLRAVRPTHRFGRTAAV